MEKTRRLPILFTPVYFLPRGFLIQHTFSGMERRSVVQHLLVPGRILTDFNDAEKFKGTFVIFPYLSSDKKTNRESRLLSTMDDFGSFGIEFSILSCRKIEKERLSLELYGERKVRLVRIAGQELFFQFAEVADVNDYGTDYFEAEGLRRDIEDLMKRLINNGIIKPEYVARCLNQKDIAAFADSMIAVAIFSLGMKDAFMEGELREFFTELNVVRRLRAVFDKFGAMLKQLEEEKVQKRIKEKTQENMADDHRKAILYAQKKQLEKELGYGSADDVEGGQDDWEKRIKEADMPPEAEKQARRDLELYKRNTDHQIEAEVHRKHLEYLCDCPWSKSTEDNLDLINARRILADDHYGLAHVNKRILEHLAVRKLKPDKKGSIFCFGGPPGTGKTHCGKAIARTMGREFVRVSLGGVKDEAEIRGHRRTYVGALPGRIIKGMIKAGTKNPVFLLDEIDKMSSDKGDPAAALLEVLDPEQNYAFSDHYLEVPFDLSQVMFICTSNYNENIPATLRDRLEMLDFAGYTMPEKMGIAKIFLLPKQIEENGLTGFGLEVSDDAVRTIIGQYTAEAGVRNLEREIATALRSRAILIGEGKPFEKLITKEELPNILGPIRFEEKKTVDADMPGVVTGLAVTPAGGCTMIIETIKMKKKGEVGELTITGNLRSVMRESVMVSFDCARAYLAKTGCTEDPTAKWDFHLHCDDHEIGKDGPSAGGAITLAFISLFTGRRIRNDLAMTGEIILRGKIWPVGGIKHKVLAAHRAGYKHVFIPKKNGKDLPEIPDEVKSGMNIMLAETIDDVVKFALLPA